MIMATFFQNIFSWIFFLIKRKRLLFGLIILSPLVALTIGKIYQGWDNDSDRGAIAIQVELSGKTIQLQYI
jgi:hypothetical protein